jgi:transposase-like protein
VLKYGGRETMPTIGDYCHTRILGRTRSDPIGGFPDHALTTNKLGSHESIRVPHLRLTCPHQQRRRANNRAEKFPSSRATTRAEMQRSKSAGSARRFPNMDAAVHNTFNLQRQLIPGRR